LKKRVKVNLAWSGAVSSNVDILRGGLVIATTANTGSYTDNLVSATGTYTYQVCEAGTGQCSNEEQVSF
jgi:hypothetical protein